MAEKKSTMWAWALRPDSGARALGLLGLACIILAVAGLVVPFGGILLSHVPLGPAIVGAGAALAAVILAWPLRFILRRRAGYYDDKEGKA